MNAAQWLEALTVELSRHGVDPEAVRHVVAEAATHLRESGEHPMRVFGSPAGYASAVADSLGPPPPPPPGPTRPPGPVRLHATGISKRYGRRTVLPRTDLTVRAGQIAAVVGANGCGKSTFLRICAGLVTADSGQVSVVGSLGYCPQQGGTADFLLADEHFTLFGAAKGLRRRQAQASGRAAVRVLGWDAPTDTAARHLSGGTRQKLNLALTTMTQPDVLLLDEPYQGFDRGTYLNFWDQLWQLRDAGKAVVVVTHLLTQLDRVDVVLDLTPAPTTPGGR